MHLYLICFHFCRSFVCMFFVELDAESVPRAYLVVYLSFAFFCISYQTCRRSISHHTYNRHAVNVLCFRVHPLVGYMSPSKFIPVNTAFALASHHFDYVTSMVFRLTAIRQQVFRKANTHFPCYLRLHSTSRMAYQPYEGEWTSKKVRQTFFDYFQARGHTFMPSSSTIPYEDPTLLFANAGMNQVREHS